MQQGSGGGLSSPFLSGVERGTGLSCGRRGRRGDIVSRVGSPHSREEGGDGPRMPSPRGPGRPEGSPKAEASSQWRFGRMRKPARIVKGLRLRKVPLSCWGFCPYPPTA
ncbi:hypothetical protein HPP92_008123 [Vanilla planifolia]|uniref:Uncharacterized protein n=1 Tax=Vanilla planifolia TaxID=51239 RepID=A0A835RNQ1_VANPL|nr:hypothetical protein HPP92_008123 [Vanilla planifolia]